MKNKYGNSRKKYGIPRNKYGNSRNGISAIFEWRFNQSVADTWGSNFEKHMNLGAQGASWVCMERVLCLVRPLWWRAWNCCKNQWKTLLHQLSPWLIQKRLTYNDAWRIPGSGKTVIGPLPSIYLDQVYFEERDWPPKWFLGRKKSYGPFDLLIWGWSRSWIKSWEALHLDLDQQLWSQHRLPRFRLWVFDSGVWFLYAKPGFNVNILE